MKSIKRLKFINRAKSLFGDDYFNISIKLDKDFKKTLTKLIKKYGPEITKINGFSKDQLDYTNFIDNFTADNAPAADKTIDASANVKNKDVAVLLNEMNKPHLKLLSFNKIYYEVKKEYGKSTADKWLEREFSGWLYMHDAHSTSFYSYCYAYELKNLAEKGLYFLPESNIAPPQHLTTFMSFLREFVVYVSNRTAGACALPSFFVYTWYFWNKDIQNGYFLKDPEYYREQAFQQFIFEINQIHTRIIQSAYTNLIIMDRNYISEIFGDRIFPDGSLVIDHVEEIIEHQKKYMEVEAKIRHTSEHTYPVYSYALLFQNDEFVDQEFARWAVKANMEWFDSNIYMGNSVTNLASCCRMLNDVSKQKQFQSSIGGSLVEIGSVKVSTINLMRLALESGKNKIKFMELLDDTVKLNMLVLDRVRHIIKRNIEKGLLQNYSYELINLDKQTITNGITAMYETIEYFGFITKDEFGNVSYTEEGRKFAGDIMDRINKLQDDFNDAHDYRASLEVIPGESANVKLCAKDNIIFNRNEKYIYSNQWTSLMEKSTMQERISLAAELDTKAGGGQILHITTGSNKLSFEQCWEIVNDMARQGVIYAAFNPELSVCKHMHTFWGDTCPICGEEKNDTVTRIVGYLVPMSSYSAPRYKETSSRYKYDLTSGDVTR